MSGYGLPLPWGIIPAERLRRTVLVPNPAAGVDWSVAVPGGKLWVVDSITAVLATSAVVANRFANLIVSDGSADVFSLPPNAAQAASLARTLSWVSTYSGPSTFTNGNRWSNGFPSWYLDGGYTIRTVTQAIDAGDQWSAIALVVDQYEVRGLERALERYARAVAESGGGGS